MSQLIDRPIVPKDGQKPRSEPANPQEKLRYQQLKMLPCAACRKLLNARFTMNCDIQHITSSGRRMSNLDTYPLCKWHHQGYVPAGFKTSIDATIYLGPSFAKSKKEFEAYFGNEESLLAETNKLLGPNVTMEGAK